MILKMFCKNCGAAVSGKYCCVCGTRIRTQLEEYRVAERRARKAFEFEIPSRDLFKQHLASACWLMAEAKFTTESVDPETGEVVPGAYENLRKAENYARELYSMFLRQLAEQ